MSIPAAVFKAECLKLMDQVARTGQPVVITKHGKPVARLVGAVATDRARVQQAVDELLRLRRGTRLDGLDWRALRDTGQR